MTARKARQEKARRRRVVRVDCGDLLYLTEDGEQAPLRVGEWVEFHRKQTPRDLQTVLAFADLADGGNAALVGELGGLCDFLARKISAWNWTDLDSDEVTPYPEKPTAALLMEMDFDDVLHLVNLYLSLVEPSKN